MTAIDTTTDLEILEQLDEGLDPACEQLADCDQPAAWAARCRHCGILALCCNEHQATMIARRFIPWHCNGCRTSTVDLLDLITFTQLPKGPRR